MAAWCDRNGVTDSMRRAGGETAEGDEGRNEGEG